jgi:hypothetical protein
MALGESAPGLRHLPPAPVIGQQGIDLGHQIIGVTDGQRSPAGNGFARRVGKISR